MDSIESNVSVDAHGSSVGCDLVAGLVKAKGSVKVAARVTNASPGTIRTWARHRRKPSFDAIYEMMVYDDWLLREVLNRIENRRAECLKK